MTEFTFVSPHTGDLLIQSNQMFGPLADYSKLENSLSDFDFIQLSALETIPRELAEISFYESTYSRDMDFLSSYPIKLIHKLKNADARVQNDLDEIDAVFEPESQKVALSFQRNALSKEYFVQVGGNGIHALKSLFHDFNYSILISPVKNEVLHFIRVAQALKLDHRIFAAVSLGEFLPIESEKVDFVYFGGSLHHTREKLAWAEGLRILRPSGRIVAVESFRSLGYGFGASLLGKRERDVNCKVLDKVRVQALHRSFEDLKVNYHGAFYRYILVAFSKLLKTDVFHRRFIFIQLLLGRITPIFLNRYFGSSIVLMQEKSSVPY